MKYKGKIEKLNKLIVSDPSYGKDVWCRYQRSFKNKEDWNVNIFIEEQDYMKDYDGEDFHIQRNYYRNGYCSSGYWY